MYSLIDEIPDNDKYLLEFKYQCQDCGDPILELTFNIE